MRQVAARLLAKGDYVRGSGLVTETEVHPRGCRGNVHVKIKDNNKTHCYYAEAIVEVTNN